MNAIIESHRREIVYLCRKHQVNELYLFGSALRADFATESDIDFLVVFDREKTTNGFHQYFDFKEKLEALLDRPVDLVCYGSIRNPFFKEEIEETKRMIYAA